MDENILRLMDITKSYGKQKVLDNVCININKGDIYGIIGKNGCGKTTIIRIICGLVLQDNGSVQLFGKNFEEDIINERKRIGALIENPGLYDNMTVRENLELVKIQRGIPGNKCVEEVLELVNFKNIAHKKVKKLSLGMKQRLAIAIALINNPELLILDEPINGLDPIGIKEVRSILLKLNKERKTTILISSHILSELTKVCNKYGFVDNGKVVEEITMSDYKIQCKIYLNVKVNNVEDVIPILERDLDVREYDVISNNEIRIYDEFNGDKIICALSKCNIYVKELCLVEENLEDYFNKLAGGNQND